jgi:Pro-kumamolisin, activation domain
MGASRRTLHGLPYWASVPRAEQEFFFAMSPGFLSSSLFILSTSLVLGAAPSAFSSEGTSSNPSTSKTAGTGLEFAPIGMDPVYGLARATDVGAANPEEMLNLCVSMPYARPDAMQEFVDAVSNPNSPSYRHFITPEQVGERFGLPMEQVNQVADYLRGQGFELTLISKNHTTIFAVGTVAQAEAAFHTTIREFTLVPQFSVEPTRFIANSTPVQMPASLAPLVIDISGLETYTRPMPRTTLLNPALTRGLYNTVGMFNAGFTGVGRTVAVSNWDGFRASNWTLYINHFSLPYPPPPGGIGSNIAVIPCGGGGAGAGPTGGEGDLDIQMELGMAPLANIKVYDGTQNGNLGQVLAQEVNDNLADTISESWGWNLGASAANACHNSHLSMSAQGITYMAASGDNGTGIEPFSYPDREPEVLIVGGTVANVNNSNGQRISEVGWGGSGGGWSNNTASWNVRPSWQVGTGIPAVNGTNNHRLLPDVGFHAAGNGTGAYQFYTGGAIQNGFVGTSFASPIFTGMLGIIEEKAISLGGLPADSHGKQRFGRIADLIYGMNGRSDIWHDITSGANGNLPDGTASTCHTGWDFVTGWGPMDCEAFADAAACMTGGCGPGTAYCAGDSVDPIVTTFCPCFNFGALGHGCSNSVDSNGSVLTANGSSNPDTVVFTASEELPTALSIVLQGTSNTPAGLVFGDGIRCVSGTLKRLYTKAASGGVVVAPGSGDMGVRARSAALGDTIPSGSTRYYQVYYRDANATFCPAPTGGTFNISNAYQITWP